MSWQRIALCLRPEVLALCFGEWLCTGVIRQEGSFRRTAPHGQVGVQQQVREAGGEVGDKVIGDGAQGLLDISRQLSVMVLLLDDNQKNILTPKGAFF